MSAATSNKLSEVQKTNVKALIAKYDGRGWSTYMLVDLIKNKLGIAISQPMVAIYRRQMLAESAKDYKDSRQEAKAQEIEQLRDIRREAWAAYERSMKDAEKEVEEFATYPDDGSSAAGSEVRIKRITTREGRLPSNQYLQTVMATLQAERELLGLDVEKKQAQTVVNVFNFDMLAKSLSEPVGDPVGDKLRQLEHKEEHDEQAISIDPPVPDVRESDTAGQA